jgi:hypothetical protein
VERLGGLVVAAAAAKGLLAAHVTAGLVSSRSYVVKFLGSAGLDTWWIGLLGGGGGDTHTWSSLQRYWALGCENGGRTRP